ncbi:MAG: hypothetical protein IIA41_13720 [SAR324 cluster bacterium]|nr:hypothetical protein [SAR324 cluster bacterium]
MRAKFRSDTHEVLNREEPVRGSSDRAFGLVMAGFLALVGVWPLLDSNAPRYWAVAIAVGFLGVGLARPRLLHPLNVAWTRLGLLLSRVVNPILLGLIYYGVFTPIGVTMRVLGKNPLKLHFDRNIESYWTEKSPPGPPSANMKNQF